MDIVTFFFLDVNQSGPRTSSIAKHIFMGSKRRLHGPWCERPLKLVHVTRGNGREIEVWFNYDGANYQPLLLYMICSGWIENSKWEIGDVFVVRVLTPINGCHCSANFAWTSKVSIFVKVKKVVVFVEILPSCSHHLFNFKLWTCSGFQESFCIYVVRTWDILHASIAKWLAPCDLQLWASKFVKIHNYWVVIPPSGSYTHVSLVSQVNSIDHYVL